MGFGPLVLVLSLGNPKILRVLQKLPQLPGNFQEASSTCLPSQARLECTPRKPQFLEVYQRPRLVYKLEAQTSFLIWFIWSSGSFHSSWAVLRHPELCSGIYPSTIIHLPINSFTIYHSILIQYSLIYSPSPSGIHWCGSTNLLSIPQWYTLVCCCESTRLLLIEPVE